MTTPLTPDDETSDLTLVANDVIRAIDGLRKEISSTQKYGRRNRMLIWAVAGSVALDLFLSIALFTLFHKTNEAANLAKQASSAQVVSCRAGNETRKIQTELWNTILAFPPEEQETEEAVKVREQRVAEFRRYIDVAFRQQDCEKLVGR